MNYEAFFAYAVERERVRRRREAGKPKPWTEDPILQRYRFCNVFREDDKVTRWIRPRITLERCGERLLPAMLAARWINYIPTLERCEQAIVDCDFDQLPDLVNDLKQVVTGAYVINTRAADMAARRVGMGPLTKMEGIVWCLNQSKQRAMRLQQRIQPGETTLEEVSAAIAKYPSQGPFTAYEITTDLRHTPLLDRAPDIMTWANPGPGAMRGAFRVLGHSPHAAHKWSPRAQRLTLETMRELLKKVPQCWPSDWPSWELRDVEHTLCEFDKYMRARLGEGRPKQPFNGME